MEQGAGKRLATVAIVAVVIILLLIGLWFASQPAPEPPAPAPAPAPAASGEAASPPAPQTRTVEPQPSAPPAAEKPATEKPAAEKPAPTPPTFDVARIAPEGTAVLAGRTPPESTVDVLANGQVIGTAKAEGADGAWALVVDKPLPEGTVELSLIATMPDGSKIKSTDVVLVDVPRRGTAGQDGGGQAVAVVTDRGDTPGTTGETRILQGPDGQPPAQAGEKDVTLDLVEYGPDGAPVLAGRAPAGTVVRLYLDGAVIGEAQVSAEGKWRTSPQGAVAPGRYVLRLDAVGADGKVVARRELPFERAAPEALANQGQPGAGTTAATRFTVQPGNSLWRIARSHLGSGYRYIDLYRANREQIRDPDLIYPGQVLDLPR